MCSFRTTITSFIKTLAVCILLTLSYISLMLKFAAIQFFQRYFVQHILQQVSEYVLVLDSGKLMDMWLILLLEDLTFYYVISRFTAFSPQHPKEIANLKSCLWKLLVS